MYFVIIIAVGTGEAVVASWYMNIRSIVIIYNYFRGTILVFWRGRCAFDRLEKWSCFKNLFRRNYLFYSTISLSSL